uniref:Uncharacterized protein n=1 Tax=Arundo donax TaxID=35708 RepID=A0A0A9FYF2_ARUDO
MLRVLQSPGFILEPLMNLSPCSRHGAGAG